MQDTTLGIKNMFLTKLSIYFLFILFIQIANAQVGIGTLTPLSTFEVNGSNGQTVTTITANTTLDATHSIVVCNNGSTAITVTLPDVTLCTGRVYTIKRNATTTAIVTIAGTIDGGTNLILNNASDAVMLFSNGTEWKATSNSSSSSAWSIKGNTGTVPATNFIGTADAQDFVLKTNNTEKLRVLSTGNVGIGVTVPTASLQLKAGSTSVGTAPLKLTTQASPLTTVEQGTMELIGNSLQFSQLLKRRGVAMSQSVLVADQTVANTTTESAAIISAEHGPNYLEIGKSEEIVCRGTIKQTTTGAGQLKVFVKYAGATIQTITTVSANILSGTPFEIRVTATCRSKGATGTMQFNSVLWVDGVTNIPDSTVLATIDTTTAQNTTITLKWTVADPNNTITVNQGRVLCIEPNR